MKSTNISHRGKSAQLNTRTQHPRQQLRAGSRHPTARLKPNRRTQAVVWPNARWTNGGLRKRWVDEHEVDELWLAERKVAKRYDGRTLGVAYLHCAKATQTARSYAHA